MKLSQLFTKTRKDVSKDEESINAQLLTRGGFIYKNSAGVYSFLPLGWRVMQKIAKIIREEMDVVGGQEMLMSALHDKKYLTATGRWDVDVVYKVISGEQKDPQYNISWTHEEVMTEIASHFINSYKDLPFAAYQIQTKFRHEARAKSGLLRAREFMMKDLYSFHTNEEDLNKYYEVVKDAYLKIFKRVGLKIYYTLAGGGDFTTNLTHEFQAPSEVGEDTIYACDKCNYAENKEITKLKDGDKCQECQGKIQEIKSIEVGNIFRYGTKYSKAFNLQFTDKDGKSKFAQTGAYGIGLSRVMGTLVEVLHDEDGIIWPESVSPFKVHLISLKTNADKIYSDLQKAGVEVLYDDREEISAGQKFSDADLIGCPIRLIISEKTLEKESVEYKERNKKDIEMVKISDLVRKLK